MNKYNYLEVCSGCGGLSYGLEMSGLNPYALYEIDKNCIKTLNKNFTCNKIYQSDIKKINFTEYKNKINIVVGGIPCQSFSISGKRKGLEDENKGGLFYDFLRILDEIEPDMFLIENVEGLLNINKGETLKKMIIDLENKNFDVYYKVLDARYYNVPQKRRRLIIIGTTLNTPFKFPKEFTHILTMRDALLNVPQSNGIKYSEKKEKIMQLIPQGGCWINLPEQIKIEYMGKCIHLGGGKRGIARRISWDEPCLTLTTSPCQKQTERCHPDETRPLTIREYARIQSFPDSFVFEGSTNNIYKQIGNAVPCMLAYYIGCEIKKTLNKIIIKKLINKLIIEILFNNTMHGLEDIIKQFYINNIIKIYEDKVDRRKTKIDEIKKETDKICYNFTDEEWLEFDNNRLKDKQVNNKIGELHEYLLANCNKFCKANDIDKNLQVDIMKKDYSIFIEVKNKYNTMNASSRESTINKLKKIKEMYPDSLCLIGIINGKNYIKQIDSSPEIFEYSGEELFNLVFNDKNYYKTVKKIIKKSLKKWINEYRNKILFG